MWLITLEVTATKECEIVRYMRYIDIYVYMYIWGQTRHILVAGVPVTASVASCCFHLCSWLTRMPSSRTTWVAGLSPAAANRSASISAVLLVGFAFHGTLLLG